VPSSCDRGEALRILTLSVTEREANPLKYPTIFDCADDAVIAKQSRASVQ
jgi:hydrogenase nickel incorporation protein HypB